MSSLYFLPEATAFVSSLVLNPLLVLVTMGYGARCYETVAFAVQVLGHDSSCLLFIAYWTTLGTLDISYLWSLWV